MSEQDRIEGVTIEEKDAEELNQQRKELASYTLEKQGVNLNIEPKDVEFRTPGHVIGSLSKPVSALDGTLETFEVDETGVISRDVLSAPKSIIPISGSGEERGFAVNLAGYRSRLKAHKKSAKPLSP